MTLYISRGSVVKNLPAKQETWVPSLVLEDRLEKEVAIHSSILAWEIHGFIHAFSMGNPMERGAWWATVQRVTKQSDTT